MGTFDEIQKGVKEGEVQVICGSTHQGKSKIENIFDVLSSHQPSTLYINFNNPFDANDEPLLSFAAVKKKFEEIESYDLRYKAIFNRYRVIVLHDGKRIRFLKGEVYANHL